uniref:Ubiquitin specific peptidase 18 n=1 Tax=Xiphophorus maculatus TaxID=8083 RepID=M3ZQM9_XIPMA
MVADRCKCAAKEKHANKKKNAHKLNAASKKRIKCSKQKERRKQKRRHPRMKCSKQKVLKTEVLQTTRGKMRGLFNYYLSCCVNSLLQTLNATWEWKSAGVRAEDNVPFQLKRILKMMQEDLPHPAPHMDFLRCLDRNLSVQHDADEVFFSILGFIQRQMDDRTLALEIQNLYKISVETQVQCLECNNVQTRNSHLLSLPLHIKDDRNSLKDCIISFFEQQELRGIDCCFCAQCEAKTPTKQVRMGFSFYQFTRERIKINKRRTDEPKNIKHGKKMQKLEQNDCRYTLYAVVVHYGDAMWGHYTAYVRHRVSNRWYYADDSHVSQSSWEDVQKTEGHHYR